MYIDGENRLECFSLCLSNMEKSLHLQACQSNASLKFDAHAANDFHGKYEEHEIGATRLLIFASFIQLFYWLARSPVV